MARKSPVALRFEKASPVDARGLAELRTAVAVDLTARWGKGHWSFKTSEKGALLSIRSSHVTLGWHGEDLAASFSLTTKKPWAIDKSCFTPCDQPLYLVSVAVAPRFQGQGMGALCLAEAERVARAWPADALRLDTYDSDAGAARFYACGGLREVGRAVYRGTPLRYFEKVW